MARICDDKIVLTMSMHVTLLHVLCGTPDLFTNNVHAWYNSKCACFHTVGNIQTLCVSNYCSR